MVAFSVAIPNFNYGHYIGQTIESVLAQGRSDVEVHVSDNASTDDSRDVVTRYSDAGVRLSVNRTNVGFSANLDRAVGPTAGNHVVLLSSDDLMLRDALATYERALSLVADADKVVLASSVTVVDANGQVIGRQGPPAPIWSERDHDKELSKALGVTVLSATGSEVLRRSVLSMRSPLPFCSTLYPRRLYDAVEGYGGGRLINPDKWFHWRLVARAQRVVFIDEPLFAYRVHGGNQGAQQTQSGALKHLVDEYVTSMQVLDELAATAGLDQAAVIRAFLRNDVVERGLQAILDGDVSHARRATHFALATYPAAARRYLLLWGLRALLAAGPGAPALARLAVKVLRIDQTPRLS